MANLNEVYIMLQNLIVFSSNIDDAIKADKKWFLDKDGIDLDLDTINDSRYPYDMFEILLRLLYESPYKMYMLRNFLKDYPIVALHLIEGSIRKVDEESELKYLQYFEEMLNEIGVAY